MPLRKSSDKNSLFPLINKISTHFFSYPTVSNVPIRSATPPSPFPGKGGKRKKQAESRNYQQHKNKKGDRSLPKIK